MEDMEHMHMEWAAYQDDSGLWCACTVQEGEQPWELFVVATGLPGCVCGEATVKQICKDHNRLLEIRGILDEYVGPLESFSNGVILDCLKRLRELVEDIHHDD